MTNNPIQRYVKDPASTLDYTIDWGAKWLEPGDTITAHTFTVPAGITKETSTNTTASATVWLSGGTVGVVYQVACQITTAGGRVDERTIAIWVMDR